MNPPSISTNDMIIETTGLNLWYGPCQALRQVSIPIRPRQVTALIGPSGCGKSTLLRCFNRMNDLVPDCRVDGPILYDGTTSTTPGPTWSTLRKRVGMVFQKPNPFPKSIFENIAYGPPRPRREGPGNARRDRRARPPQGRALGRGEGPPRRVGARPLGRAAAAALHRPDARGRAGSDPDGRALLGPRPDRDGKIEDLIDDAEEDYTVIIVTHNMQQAARVSDYTGFMYLGELIEYGETLQVFERPTECLTENYITGRFG